MSSCLEMSRVMKVLYAILLLAVMNHTAYGVSLTAKSSNPYVLGKNTTNGNLFPEYSLADIYYIGFYNGVIDNVSILNGTVTLNPHVKGDASCGNYAQGLSFPYSGPLVVRLPAPISRECKINLNIQGEIINNNDKEISLFTGLTGYYADGKRSNSASGGVTLTIPAPSYSCQITMDDSINFGQLNPGLHLTKELALSITSGNPLLLINGPDIQADGTLYLGGNSKVTVFPQNVSSAGMGGWVSGGTIPLTINIDKTAIPGEYVSALTATLTCR